MSSCVSTDIDTRESSLLCSSRAAASDENALVRVVVNFADKGQINCSGVAIAPRLVATALQCVVKPNELVGETPARPDTPNLASQNYPKVFDYVSLCDMRNGWAPIEDGSFAAMLGEPVEASDIGVYINGADGEQVFGPRVRAVHRAPATSQCSNSLAILVLDSPVVDSPFSVRLDDTTKDDEPVMLLSREGSGRVRRISSRIDHMTFTRGTEDAPPYSVVVGAQDCIASRGGPVVSLQTGAVIGVVTGFTRGCVDPEGKILAVRLAPFRAMVLEAAREGERDYRLQVEPDWVNSPGIDIPPCAGDAGTPETPPVTVR